VRLRSSPSNYHVFTIRIVLLHCINYVLDTPIYTRYNNDISLLYNIDTTTNGPYNTTNVLVKICKSLENSAARIPTGAVLKSLWTTIIIVVYDNNVLYNCTGTSLIYNNNIGTYNDVRAAGNVIRLEIILIITRLFG